MLGLLVGYRKHVSVTAGADKLVPFKMTAKSTTIRFRCADCQTYIGMHPEGFPILALNPGLGVDGNLGTSQKVPRTPLACY